MSMSILEAVKNAELNMKKLFQVEKWAMDNVDTPQRKNKDSRIWDLLSKGLNQFNWGQFVVSKVQFVFTLLIFLKIYEVSLIITVLLVVVMLILTWIIGVIFDKKLRVRFQKENYKGVFNENDLKI